MSTNEIQDGSEAWHVIRRYPSFISIANHHNQTACQPEVSLPNNSAFSYPGAFYFHLRVVKKINFRSLLCTSFGQYFNGIFLDMCCPSLWIWVSFFVLWNLMPQHFLHSSALVAMIFSQNTLLTREVHCRMSLFRYNIVVYNENLLQIECARPTVSHFGMESSAVVCACVDEHVATI